MDSRRLTGPGTPVPVEDDSRDAAVEMEQTRAAPGPIWPAILTAFVLVAGLIVLFGKAFVAMWGNWFPMWGATRLSFYDRLVEGDSYYTHGPLVAAVSLAIVVALIRYTSVVVKPRPASGAAVLAASLFLQVVAVAADIAFPQGFLFIGVLAGLVLALWGAQALRRFWFPIVFLVFMVPMHAMIIQEMNFRLKLLAAEWGVAVASFLGVPVERAGAVLYLAGAPMGPPKTLVVGGVCSGLRTLISLIAFAAIYAYVCRLRGLWRLGLFAMAVPVAVVSNGMRIVSLIVVAHIWDEKVATGWYHDTSGLLVFALAFGMMFGLEALVLWARRVAGRPAVITPLFHDCRRTDPLQGRAMLQAMGARGAWTACLLVALGAAGAWALSRPAASVPSGERVRGALPPSIQMASTTCESEELTLDENTLRILQTRDYVYRRYRGPGVPPGDVCIIFSQDNRRGVHPPEVCLEAGGLVLEEIRDVTVSQVPGHGDLRCREILARSGGHQEYYLYAFRSGSDYEASYLRHQASQIIKSLLRRGVGSCLLRISTPVEGGNVAAARQRAEELFRMSVKHLDEVLQN